MRFFGLIVTSVLAVVAFAQTKENVINNPPTGWDVSTGGSTTITWSQPSSGTVTIRLTQGGNLTPGSGDLLVSGIPASAGTATVTIPASLNMAAYNFEIIDDTNPDNVNFSSSFTVAGGTLTGSSSVASMSMSGTSSASSSSGTSSASGTDSSASSSSRSSASSSASSASSSSSASSASASSSSSASRSSSSSASMTSASASATSVSSTNGAGYVKAGGFLAVLAGAIAVF